MEIEKEIAKLKEIIDKNVPAPEINKFNIAAANLALSYV